MTDQEGSPARRRRGPRVGSKPGRCWTHTEGRRGFTVTVYERGGQLTGRFRHPITKQLVRRRLPDVPDRDAAKTWAADQAAKLRKGTAILNPAAPVTLVKLIAAYQAHVSPTHAPAVQQDDARRAELWVRWLGANRRPDTITPADLFKYRDARLSGACDARGVPRPSDVKTPADRRRWRGVRVRAVEDDLEWLSGILRWAERSRDPYTQQTRIQRNHLRDDDFKGLWDSVKERNPRQPVAGTDRYRAIRAVAAQVPMVIRWHGKKQPQPSYLPELLELVVHTGRRINAILQLRWDDILLGKEYGTHGAIDWPAGTDKEDTRWLQPMTTDIRAAVDRIRTLRPGIGSALLFPGGVDPRTPITDNVARAWLLKAEALAGVQKHDGSAWHAFRRGWATARKHFPVKDLAKAGGWKATQSVDRYIQTDDDTIMQVMTGARDVRERRA